MTDLSPPPSVKPYVDVLGPDLAMSVFLQFGGSEVYFSAEPKGRSEIEKTIGAEKFKELGAQMPNLAMRIPLANRWLANLLHSRGVSRQRSLESCASPTQVYGRF